MNTAHLELAPPPQPGRLRAIALAILAHALLLAALAWGVHWRRDAESPVVEAELWSAVPQEAAPRAVELPPPPPAPSPPPAQPEARPPESPAVRDADIALEREKQRREQEKFEQEKREQQKKEQAEKLKADKAAADKKRLEQAQKEKEKQKEQEALRRAQEAQARQQKEADAKRAEAQRQENLRRLQGLAGSTAPQGQGNAPRATGPSAGYPARVAARVKPNIVFPDDIAGNPMAEVEVRTAPDGTIVSRKLVTPSGVPAWDATVLKALDKTQTMPRDVDGRVPPELILSFRPKD